MEQHELDAQAVTTEEASADDAGTQEPKPVITEDERRKLRDEAAKYRVERNKARDALKELQAKLEQGAAPPKQEDKPYDEVSSLKALVDQQNKQLADMQLAREVERLAAGRVPLELVDLEHADMSDKDDLEYRVNQAAERFDALASARGYVRQDAGAIPQPQVQAPVPDRQGTPGANVRDAGDIGKLRDAWTKVQEARTLQDPNMVKAAQQRYQRLRATVDPVTINAFNAEINS